MTADEALSNAVRLLQAAEDHTDRELMGRYTDLGNAWLDLAGLLLEREKI